jgi:hypothetical protein
MRRALVILGILTATSLAIYCASHYDSPYTMAGHTLMLAFLVMLGRQLGA